MKRIILIAILMLSLAPSCRKEQNPGPPPALFSIRVSNEDVTATAVSITVRWPNIIRHEAYELIISDVAEALDDVMKDSAVYTTNRTYTFENLTPNTRYRIWIRALNNTYGISSEYTSWDPITTQAEP